MGWRRAHPGSKLTEDTRRCIRRDPNRAEGKPQPLANTTIWSTRAHCSGCEHMCVAQSRSASGSWTDEKEARPTWPFCVRSTPRCGPAPALRPTFGCVPRTDLSSRSKVGLVKKLFDRLIGAGEHGGRNGKTERFRNLEVDHQHEP